MRLEEEGRKKEERRKEVAGLITMMATEAALAPAPPSEAGALERGCASVWWAKQRFELAQFNVMRAVHAAGSVCF
jgi:hypothetical protein